ncbi:MAG: 16S rRNA (guanine(966)-N(2))-methyltransferase RsmD [Candidatus Omnitrophica bacterium]|nr:16S rRNA (guanine(966)-N(2))-methyltransferase RsmD [Candidatus Omnitrophota bacterium]
MKILTGEYSGRNFFRPIHIRPTQNILRKAVFDIIGRELEGISFLDLFSGSGAVGLEALSCGASEVHMVERDPKAVETIQENLMIFKPMERGLKAYVVAQDSFKTIKEFARENKRFHVVFCDPPYGLRLARKTLKTLLSHDILHPSSFVIVQYDDEERLPDVEGKLRVVKNNLYGTSRLIVYQKQEHP